MSLDITSGAGQQGSPFGVSRTLQVDNTGDTRALALKVFSGTVLEQFYTNTVFYDRASEFISQKVLDGGHMAQWPVIGDDLDLFNSINGDVNSGNAEFFDAADVGAEGGIKAGYHNPGEFITGRKVKMAERTVRVDDVLVAPIDVPFADLDLNHFDVLTPYAQKLARSLAIDNDRKIAALGYRAARTSGVSGIFPGGTEVVRTVSGASDIANGASPFYADSITGSGNFRADVATLAMEMDLKNIPEQGRYLFISPQIRKLLRHEKDVFNRDYNEASIAGTMNARAIGVLEGFQLVTTNNLPGQWTATTNGRYGLIDSNFGKYDFDCALATANDERPAAIALCGASSGMGAIGMVQASGIRTVIEDDERRNVKFMKAQMHVGYDVLAPWCAGSITCKRLA